MTWTAEDWPIAPSLNQFSETPPGAVGATGTGPAVWRPVFREVRLAGFESFDAFDSWVRIGDLDDASLASFGRVAGEEGLSICALSTSRRSPIADDPAIAVENLAYLHRALDAADGLGVRTICMGLHEPLTRAQVKAQWFWHADGVRNPLDDREVYERAVTAFAELGEHAARLGEVISLELYEDTYLGDGSSSVRFVHDVGRENVGLNPDLGNLVRLHRPVEDWRDTLAAMAPYTNYWHVKNYIRDVDPATGAYFTAPSSLELGFIDYRAALRTVLASGYEAPICVEQYGGDALSVSATNMRYLRSLLSQLLAL